MSTTVHYRGRERFTLKDCEYYSTLQRERKVHNQGLLVPQYTTEGEKGSHLRTVSTTVHYREKGSHSRNVSTTVHYRGRERFTLKGCWYHGTLQRKRKVHTQGLLLLKYTTQGERGSHSRAVDTTVHYRGREKFTLKDCDY